MVNHYYHLRYTSPDATPLIRMVQGDTGNVLVFFINTSEYTLTGVEQLVFSLVRQGDNAAWSYSAEANILDNSVTVPLITPNAALNKAGTLTGRLTIAESEKQVTSYKITIIVDPWLQDDPTSEEVAYLQSISYVIQDKIEDINDYLSGTTADTAITDQEIIAITG